MSTLRHMPTLWLFLALLPVIGMALAQRGSEFLILLCMAVALAITWEITFAFLRRQKWSVHGLTTGMIVAILVPGDTALWQVALVLSLGIVVGELVFGGRGFGFLNAASVVLALLVFSFPKTTLLPLDQSMAIAGAAGGLLLVAMGVASWRVLVSLLVVVGIFGGPELALTGIVVFGAIFLICDPIAASSTNPGRWIYGALVGALILVFATDATDGLAQAVVFAALLGSLFTPLIDHLVVLGDAELQRRRHG